MIFNILDNTTELYMAKYIIGEIFSSRGATLYKNPSDQTVTLYIHKYILTNTKCIYENNPAFDHTLHESSNAFPMQRSYSDQFRICNIILLSKVQKHIYTKLQESSLNVGNSKILYT